MFTLSIGDICIELNLLQKWDEDKLRVKYDGYWVNQKPDFRLTVRTDSGFKNENFSPEELGVQQVRFENGCAYFFGFNVFCEINLVQGSGYLKIDPNINALDYALDMLIMLLLPRHKGFMVHGSGSLRGEDGWLACGPSGAGKTSLARSAISIEGKVVNDERVCVVRRNGRFYLMGTPFWGEMQPQPDAARIKAPLKHLVILARGKDALVEPMEAFLGLLDNIIFPAGDTYDRYEKVMDMAWEVARTTKCHGLAFDRNRDNWRVLDGMAR